MPVLAVGKNGSADAWNYSARAQMGYYGKIKVLLSQGPAPFLELSVFILLLFRLQVRMT